MNYIVKEYETNCPEYEYSEEFDSLELAQERMHELYHELAFENTPPEVIDVITDNRVELTIAVRNNLGQQKIKIPATKTTLKSGKLEAKTWVWNLQESDLLVLPDDLYAVLYKASEAWMNICAEIHI